MLPLILKIENFPRKGRPIWDADFNRYNHSCSHVRKMRALSRDGTSYSVFDGPVGFYRAESYEVYLVLA